MVISIVGVPSSAGAYGVGQERAPDALERAGLSTELRAAGVAVADGGRLPLERFRPDPANRRQQNIDRVVGVARSVAERVGAIVDDGSIPLVVGGDCTLTLGVVAGVAARLPDVGLAYLDGDADLDTPRTTRSGILDAMGIAHLLAVDGAARPLVEIGPRVPLLGGGRVALVGYEPDDVHPRWGGLLDDAGVHRMPAGQIRGRPERAAAEVLSMLGRDAPVIVHFDVDVIDSIDCPLAHFPHFNSGLSFDDAFAVFAGLCAADRLSAITLTEVNPDHDPDGEQMRRLVRGVAEGVSRIL
jgi:arginase